MVGLAGNPVKMGLPALMLVLGLLTPHIAHARIKKPYAEQVGGSWGQSCWNELAERNPNWYKTIEAGTPCSQNSSCLNCCERKRDGCSKRYPNRASQCGDYYTYCVDEKKPAKAPAIHPPKLKQPEPPPPPKLK